jgi:murein DD-endopeptidase MepM/ murein hydrolase activator NlpD
MHTEPRKRKKIYRKLRNKYRLVVMNDETLEEKTSLRLSPLNVFVFSGTLVIGLVVFTIYLVAFTPLREYIPGYTDVTMRRKLIGLTVQSDSMQALLNAQALYLGNLRNVIDGVAGEDSLTGSGGAERRYDTIRQLVRTREDSLLRAEVEAQDQYALAASLPGSPGGIGSFYFFTPLKGTLTAEFDPRIKHFGVDIVSGPGEPIKSTLDGTVLVADWTTETGYLIGIQHANNLFSMYKHNSALLRKPGDFVKAGEVVAIVGNTGELTTGPHLHFELWYNGTAVNPLDYIAF